MASHQDSAEPINDTSQETKEEKEKTKISFREPWNNSDAILIVEDEKLHVHKCILSLWSPVFDRMFNGEFKEGNENQAVLPGKKLEDIEEMLHVIYDRRHPITSENCCSLLVFADEYQMEQLRCSCEDFLRETEKKGLNSVRFLDVAKQFNLLSLEKECLEQAKGISTDVLDLSIDYQRLSDSSKIALLSSRTKYLEGHVQEYESACRIIVEYLYHQAHEAFVEYLRKQGLENTSILVCEQYTQHKLQRVGNKFCIHCNACRDRTKHTRQYTVLSNEISAVLDKLYRLVYTE